MTRTGTRKGLFVGLVTLDFIYLAADVPHPNQKIVATDYSFAAGGPATNAAVTFGYLGNLSTLLAVVGKHPMTNLILADLDSHEVAVRDLEPTRESPPPVSSIIVTQERAERAVISLNASKTQASPDQLAPDILQGVDIVLIDGHQMAVGCHLAQMAQSYHIPVAIDGGSWKPGFEELLPFVDYAICSANFFPPGCHNTEDVMAYLADIGIPHIAITQGENPIQYMDAGSFGSIKVPQINPIDTLGAGDIFHGAFCHYIGDRNFTDALAAAAQIASESCLHFGTRSWMQVEMRS